MANTNLLGDMALVSVIIPMYNSEKYIAEAVNSVLAQTYKDIEIILIDDCSKDKTDLIAQTFAESDERIYYLRLAKNSGAAVARNKGLELSQGRYIAFLDSDDLWEPQKLEKQIKVMEDEKVGFCYTSYSIIDSSGTIKKNKIKIKERTVYNDLLQKTLIATPTVLLDRNIVGDVKMPLRRTGQDYAYWLLLLRNIDFAYGISEPLVKVRRRSDSLSRNKFQSIVDVWEVQRKNEQIKVLPAMHNLFFYIFNVFLKRYF